MTIEKFAIEHFEAPNKLSSLADATPNKIMDVKELDRPIVLTQETRGELPPLSDETRERLKNDNYSETILDNINSEAEALIYDEAKLEPTTINGKDALIRTDINYDQTDLFGNTNLDRMKEGKAPLDSNNRPIELHHIGQKQDSPLAELTITEHRGAGNDNILHNKLKESEINREDFGKERTEYWKARAEKIENKS